MKSFYQSVIFKDMTEEEIEFCLTELRSTEKT